MANIIDGVTTAVSLTTAIASAITPTNTMKLLSSGFSSLDEKAYVYFLAPSGNYEKLTNEKGQVFLSIFPNVVILEADITYAITKTATANPVYIGEP